MDDDSVITVAFFILLLGLALGFFAGTQIESGISKDMRTTLFEIHCQKEKKIMEEKRNLECKIPYKGWKFVISDGEIELIENMEIRKK